ncbi:UBP-type zinc finger domain-containing protein [Streptomyces sp. NRRL B-24484]|uniref:UBP-type zinc finger domain-containing protein n=1 Tax=Streptomyces sp. NRRL B-24484 TaxID=1463833 RepID=UPI000D128FEA
MPPSGTGCVECEAAGGWWFHPPRCARRRRIGCCDDSPAEHATAHAEATGHPTIRSFEPAAVPGLELRHLAAHGSGPRPAPPDSHPAEQPVPGPGSAVTETIRGTRLSGGVSCDEPDDSGRPEAPPFTAPVGHGRRRLKWWLRDCRLWWRRRLWPASSRRAARPERPLSYRT